MLAKWAAGMALFALLAGCGPVVPGASLPVPAADRRIVAEARIAAPAGYRTQAVVSALTPADVNRLRFELWETVGGADSWVATEETPEASGTSQTVDWEHLKRNWTYKLKVYALDSSGAILNTAGAAATLSLTTTTDDATQQASVAVHLADRVFDGRVHPIVSVDDDEVAERTDHLKFTLYEKIGGSWVAQTTASTPDGSGLSKTVDFSHLKRYTQYRLKIKLLKASGGTVESETVNFTTAADDLVTLAVEIDD